MKHNKRILILCILVSCFAAGAVAQAHGRYSRSGAQSRAQKQRIYSSGLRTTQYDGSAHLFGVHADGAYSAHVGKLVDNNILFNTPGGYNVGVGADYAFVNGRFIFQTGLGLSWQSVLDSFPPVSQTLTGLTDMWVGHPLSFDMTYDFESRYDRLSTLSLQVPVMLGGYLTEGLYMVAGPKLMVNVYNVADVSTHVSTSASYESYFIGVMEEMDNHGIRHRVPLQAKSEPFDVSVDVMAAAELGYEWVFSRRSNKNFNMMTASDYRLRVAAFAEYGLFNLRTPKENIPLYEIPIDTPYDFDTFKFRHVLLCDLGTGGRVNNFNVGIRMTFFFYGLQHKTSNWSHQNRINR